MLTLPVRYYRPYPPEAWLGHQEGAVQIDPARTAFLLVDVYLPPMGTALEVGSRADYDDKRRIYERLIAPALAAARRVRLPIIYVANSAPRIALEKAPFGKQLASAGTDFAREFAEDNVDPLEFHQGPRHMLVYPGAIAPQRGDYYVRKHAYSGFYATRLESLLRNLDVRTLVAVGIRLDGCLGTTLMDAHHRSFEVILLRDCTLACDTPEEQSTRAFTQRMILWHEMLIGPTSTSEEFVAACGDERGR